MKVCAYVERVEGKLGGGDVTFIQICEELVRHGVELKLLVAQGGGGELADSAEVITELNYKKCEKIFTWADVVFTQRGVALQSLKAFFYRKRRDVEKHPLVVFYSHNVGQPFTYGYKSKDIDLVVFNSRWVKKKTGWMKKSIVLPPPVNPSRYKTTQGDYVTQVNLAKKKGGYFFWKIVSEFPEVNFLAVKGKEDGQIIPEIIPENVKIIENTSNIRDDVYAKTKVLLVPSKIESFGRVPLEAAASGIPSIVSLAPGFKESMGGAATSLRRNVDLWSKELDKLLMNSEYYQLRSKAALSRSHEMSAEVLIESFLSKVNGELRRAKLKKTSLAFIFKCARLVKHPNKYAKKILKISVEALRYSVLSSFGRLPIRSNNKVAIMAPARSSFSDNAKYAYIFLREQSEFEVAYVVYDKTSCRDLSDKGLNAVYIKSVKGLVWLITTHVAIGIENYAFKGWRGHLLSGARKIQLWHGTGVKVFGLGKEKNAGKEIFSYQRLLNALIRKHPVYDICYFTDVEALNQRQCYFNSRNNLINDQLRNCAIFSERKLPKEADIGVDIRSKNTILKKIKEGKKVGLYAPTWRVKEKNIFGKEVDFDFSVMDEFLNDLNMHLVIKLHPNSKEPDELSSAFRNISFMDKGSDIYPVLALFDLMVTDISSISKDFSYLGKPIIGYVPDLDNFIAKKRVSVDRLESLEYEKVFSFDELMEKISLVSDDLNNNARSADNKPCFDSEAVKLVFMRDIKNISRV